MDGGPVSGHAKRWAAETQPTVGEYRLTNTALATATVTKMVTIYNSVHTDDGSGVPEA